MSGADSERRRAALLIDAGRPADAMAILAPMLAREPEDVDCLLLVSHAMSDLGRHRDAADAARRASAKSPDDERGWRALAVAEIGAGNPNVGADAARRARALDPADWHSHFLVAMADCARNDITDDTRLSVAQGLRCAPLAVEPRFAAGYVAQKAGDVGWAEKWYVEALRIDPNHREARNNLAVLRLNRGEHAQAARSFADLVGENPTSKLARANIVAAYRSALTLSAAVTVVFALAPLWPYWVAPSTVSPEVVHAFRQLCAAFAVVLATCGVTVFVIRLGRHRRAILRSLVRDRVSASSAALMAVALGCLVASSFVLPFPFSIFAMAAALGAGGILKAAREDEE